MKSSAGAVTPVLNLKNRTVAMLNNLYPVKRSNKILMRCKDTKEVVFTINESAIEKAKKGLCRVHGDVYLLSQKMLDAWQKNAEETRVDASASELWLMNCESIAPFQI